MKTMAAVAMVAALALSAGACGSSDSSQPEETTTATAPPKTAVSTTCLESFAPNFQVFGGPRMGELFLVWSDGSLSAVPTRRSGVPEACFSYIAESPLR